MDIASVLIFFLAQPRQLWNNVSDIDFVCFSYVKKFKRNYFELIIWKFTSDSFTLLNNLIINSIYNYLSISVFSTVQTRE